MLQRTPLVLGRVKHCSGAHGKAGLNYTNHTTTVRWRVDSTFLHFETTPCFSPPCYVIARRLTGRLLFICCMPHVIWRIAEAFVMLACLAYTWAFHDSQQIPSLLQH